MTARIERGGAAAIYGTTALGATLPPRRVPTKVSIPPYSGVWVVSSKVRKGASRAVRVIRSKRPLWVDSSGSLVTQQTAVREFTAALPTAAHAFQAGLAQRGNSTW